MLRPKSPIDGTLPFDQIFDIDRLQRIFDAFYEAVGISTAIVSLNEEILIESGWQRICAEFHRSHPATRETCIQSNAHTRENLISADSHAVYRCPHGMIDAATPIVIDGRRVAYLYAGQFLFTPPDEGTLAEFRARARRWGYDETAYLNALLEVPVISEERASFILQYLKAFAEMIGEVGFSRLKRQHDLDDLARAHSILKKEVARRRAESRRLAQILDGSPIPTFVIDNHHRVTHWNHACEQLTGIAADTILGTDHHSGAFYDKIRPLLADLVLDDTRTHHDFVMLYGRKARRSRLLPDSFEGEDFFPHIGQGGRWLYFCATPVKNSSGEITGAIETLQDVTDRHTAEMKMRSNEARYRQIFDSTNDGLFVLKGGVLVDCNPKAVDLFGASRAEIIGKSPIVFSPAFQPDGRQSVDAILEKNAQAVNGEDPFFEWRFLRSDCSHFDAEVSLTRSVIADEPHLLAVVRDISDRKRMIQDRLDHEKELERKSLYLEKVNEALKASLDHREVEKRAVEESILTNLKRFVFPYLESLERCDLGTEAKAYLNIIGTNLNDLISQFSTTIFSHYIDFTPTEVRIADFIRDGKNTKDIAEMLGLSPSSIQWHRKNIREKLGLTNKKVNLHTYLNTLTK